MSTKKKESLFAQRIKEKRQEGEESLTTSKGFPSTFAVDNTVQNSTPQQVKQVNPPTISQPVAASRLPAEDMGDKDPLPQPLPSAQDKDQSPSKNKSTGPRVLDVLTESDIGMIEQQNMQMLANLSPEELEKQREMLRSLLSPQSIDILKKNPNTLQRRTQAQSIPPKTLTGKEKFIKERSLHKEVGGEIDEYEQILYLGIFREDGRSVPVSKEEYALSLNPVDQSKSDEYFTLNEISELIISQVWAQGQLGLELLGKILSHWIYTDGDRDSICAHVTGEKNTIHCPKGTLARGLIQQTCLDRKIAMALDRKGVTKGVLREGLKTVRLWLMWTGLRSMQMRQINKDVFDKICQSIAGNDPQEEQTKQLFILPEFTNLLGQLLKVEEDNEVIGDIYETAKLISHMNNSHDSLSTLLTTLSTLGQSSPLTSLFSSRDSILTTQLTPVNPFPPVYQSLPTDLSLLTLLRSNMKEGARVGIYSLHHLHWEMALLSSPRPLEGYTRCRDMLTLPLQYQSGLSSAQYLSSHLSIVYDGLFNTILSTIINTDNRLNIAYVCMEDDGDRLSDIDDHIHGWTENIIEYIHNALVNRENIENNDKDKEDKKDKKRKGIWDIFTVLKYNALGVLITTLGMIDGPEGRAFRMMIFYEVMLFYSTETAGRIIDTAELVDKLIKTMGNKEIVEAVWAYSRDESRVKALIENYRYCSYGDKHFTSLLFLFTSKHSTVPLAAEIYREIIEDSVDLFDSSLTTLYLPVSDYALTLSVDNADFTRSLRNVLSQCPSFHSPLSQCLTILLHN